MRKDAARMLTQLADMGLRLHLDDFGTGYSSLSYLHRLPVDALKIDRSFVNDMVTSDISASIVATIIALSHALGAHVVAEGVETKEQLDQLRALACDWAQGYYFDRPLDVEKATALLCRVSAGDHSPALSSPAQQAPAAPEVEPTTHPRAPTMP
jgi:EAL domain-containing protein (putative c-di-GMP-specific phosphodiesterase class I)